MFLFQLALMSTPTRKAQKNDLLGDAKLLHQKLSARNLKQVNLHLQVIESANHETAFPTTAIQGLWWLFNKKDGVAFR